MKKIYLFISLFFFALSLFAQLDDGVIAPNWTLSDINGQSYTLYDYLDSGKVVIIDVSAVWCSPCWNYHNTHALRDVYNNYGPGGTDEMMVFFIEGDAASNIDCLYGLSSCNHPYGTQGDWVTGTPYPIINSTSINGSYNINYFPTIYMICPDRVITEIGQKTESEIYALAQGCPALTSNTNDVKIFELNEPQGDYCAGSVIPELVLQNYGTSTLTTLMIYELIDGNYYDTLEWTGSLDMYETETVIFPQTGILNDGNHSFEFIAAEPNGSADENSGDNTASSSFSTNSLGSPVAVKVRTDDNPGQTSWEILSGNNVVASGNGYSESSTLYTTEVCLYEDSCYTFIVYDSGNNGLNTPGFALVYWNSNTIAACSSNDFNNDEIHLDFCLNTGIQEMEKENNLVVYPVPASGITTFYSALFENNNIYKINIINSLGQNIITCNRKSENNSFTLNLNGIKSGVYFISVSNDNTYMRQKIIIN